MVVMRMLLPFVARGRFVSRSLPLRAGALSTLAAGPSVSASATALTARCHVSLLSVYVPCVRPPVIPSVPEGRRELASDLFFSSWHGLTVPCAT